MLPALCPAVPKRVPDKPRKSKNKPTFANIKKSRFAFAIGHFGSVLSFEGWVKNGLKIQ